MTIKNGNVNLNVKIKLYLTGKLLLVNLVLPVNFTMIFIVLARIVELNVQNAARSIGTALLQTANNVKLDTF